MRTRGFFILLLALVGAGISVALFGCGGNGTTLPGMDQNLEITGVDNYWLMEGGNPGRTAAVDVIGPQSATVKHEVLREVSTGVVDFCYGNGMIYAAPSGIVAAYDGLMNQQWKILLKGKANGLCYTPNGLVMVLDQQVVTVDETSQYTSDLIAINSNGQEEYRFSVVDQEVEYWRLIDVIEQSATPGNQMIVLYGRTNFDSPDGWLDTVRVLDGLGNVMWEKLWARTTIYVPVVKVSPIGHVAVLRNGKQLGMYDYTGATLLERDYGDDETLDSIFESSSSSAILTGNEELEIDIELSASSKIVVLGVPYDKSSYPAQGIAQPASSAESKTSASAAGEECILEIFSAEGALVYSDQLSGYKYDSALAIDDEHIYLWCQPTEDSVNGIQQLNYEGQEEEFIEAGLEYTCRSIHCATNGEFYINMRRLYSSFKCYYLQQGNQPTTLTQSQISRFEYIPGLDRVYSYDYSQRAFFIYGNSGSLEKKYNFDSANYNYSALRIAADSAVIMCNTTGLKALHNGNTILWETSSRSNGFELSSPSGPIITGSRNTASNSIYAYNLGGSLLWEQPFGDEDSQYWLGSYLSDFFVDGQGSMYVSSKGNVVDQSRLISKLDVNSGELLWQKEIEDWSDMEGRLLMTGGNILLMSLHKLISFSPEGEINAEYGDGEVFSGPFSDNSFRFQSLHALPNGGFLATTSTQYVAAYDAEFNEIWQYELPFDLGGQLTAAVRPDGNVVVLNPDQDGMLIVFDSTGQIEIMRHLSSYTDNHYSIRRLLVDSDNTSYVVLQHGVYAVDVNGDMMWSYESSQESFFDLAITGTGDMFVLTDRRLLQF